MRSYLPFKRRAEREVLADAPHSGPEGAIRGRIQAFGRRHLIGKRQPMRTQTKISILIGAAGLITLVVAGLKSNLPAIAVEVGTGMLGVAVTYSLLRPLLKTVLDADGLLTDGIDYRDFAGNIIKARSTVRILSTFVWPLTTRPQDKGDKILLRDALRLALSSNQKLRVQILFLDPESEAAKQRAEELQEMDEDAIHRMQESLLELHHFRDSLDTQECKVRLQVKLYDRLPPLSLYQWDHRASLSSYPRDKEISKTRRFEFPMTSPLGHFVDGLFVDLWADIKTKPLHDYIYLKLQISEKQRPEPYLCEVNFISGLEGTKDSSKYVLLNYIRDKAVIELFQRYVDGSADLRIAIMQGKQKRYADLWERSEISDLLMNAVVRKYGEYTFHAIIKLREG